MPTTLDAAVRTLSAGGLVVYPTDTLLGLAARADDPVAVARLVRAKGRPSGQPISVLVSSTEEIEPIADLSTAARRFVRTRLPGPYTVIVRPSAAVRRRWAGPIVSPAGTIGVRVPDHPIARELARRAGPITATSANRHGEPARRTIADARRAFSGAVGGYLAARPAPTGRPSALVDLTGPSPVLLTRR